MSETRRQVFKVSILSALGLMGCSPWGQKAAVVGPGSLDPENTGMLVKTSIGWLYLDPGSGGSNPSSYTAYNVTALPPPQPPPGNSNLAAYDLATIASSLTSNNLTGPKQSVTVTGPSLSTTFSIDGNSSVASSAVGNIVKLGQFTWNEIGSNVVTGSF
jgi:hypothetical protein